MKKFGFIAILIGFLAFSSGAKAVIIDFEDVDTSPDGVVQLDYYANAHWTDFHVMDPYVFDNPSYPEYIPAVSSGTQFAVNFFGDDVSITFDNPVNLIGGNFTTPFEILSPNVISISGIYSDGTTFSLSNYIALETDDDGFGIQTPVVFNFEKYVSSITFQPDNFYFGMDDLEYTPVPEPTSVALGLMSLAGLAGIRRRKK